MDFSQILSKDLFFLQQAFKNPERYGGITYVKKKYLLSQQQFIERLAKKPMVCFDGTLPVHEKYQEIKQAILENQIVIICGETGSGKTTQIPKICLELNRGVAGLIGHTQPRRLAARAVAGRIAEEIGAVIGGAVGYKVRFNDKTGPNAYIKLMTDGVLLAETQTDKYLHAYDTIIIDEAHERSLNIDFLLGYLQRLSRKRKDLKIIITSATIDAEIFSRHFFAAPIINVSGRTYPVELLYRPLASKDEDEVEVDLSEAISQAVTELWRYGRGDILVFLPGEREIREATEYLSKNCAQSSEILPLFARLSNEEQQKIFHPSGQKNRIILATNVAETSLTIPGIKYVIDSGLARLKRYSTRAKIEQLYIEKISQAAAKQRMGRCGRVSEGVCIRLYTEQDYLQRAEFTDAEIIRSNLAAVILRMAALKLGKIESFPFIDMPDVKLINDGIQVLYELGAIDEENKLTKLGQEMAKLPVDPKIARILFAGKQHDCVYEILIIMAALSIQDPRERPFDSKAAANKAHEIFADKNSDFLSYLYLWDFFQKLRLQKYSNRQLMKQCHQYFLSYLRMREWRDLVKQLTEILLEMNFRIVDNRVLDVTSKKTKRKPNSVNYEQIHRAILAGLVSNVGMKSVDGQDYIGARGSHFYLFPTSYLFKIKPKWVMAAELMQTAKIYGRNVAKIEPEWIEKEAPHLVKYHYFEPKWSSLREEVVANERVTFYGLTIITQRSVSFGRIDAVLAHEIFIRAALIESEVPLNIPFYQHNQKIIAELEAIEHKVRRQDILLDEVLYQFYFAKIPADIVDLAGFLYWLRQDFENNNQLLSLNLDALIKQSDLLATENLFPKYWHSEEGRFVLSYRFEPNHPMDGVSLQLPLAMLNKINPHSLQWLVSGMIREKLHFLLKALPKNIRRICVPIPDFITEFLSIPLDKQKDILVQLAKAIAKRGGDMNIIDIIDMAVWEKTSLPNYCLMNIQVIDDAGQELAMGRDLIALQQQLGQTALVTFRDNADEFERENLTAWTIGEIPESVKFARGKQQLIGYPGLSQDKDGHISLRLFDTEAAAQLAHKQGVIALMQLQLKQQLKDLNKGLLDFTQIVMLLKKSISIDELRNDIVMAVCNQAFIGKDALPRNETAFKEQIKRARTRLATVKQTYNENLLIVAKEYAQLNNKLANHVLNNTIKRQLDRLIYQGFVSETPWGQWPRISIYLKAMQLRLDKFALNPTRDKQKEQQIQLLETRLDDYKLKLITTGFPISAELIDYRWRLEELRVSLFAQELKTPYPVSIKRLDRLWNEIIKLV